MSNLREATKRAVWQLRHGELDTEMCLHIAGFLEAALAQPQNDAEAAEIIAGLRHAASNRSNRLQQVHEIDKAIAFLSAPPSSRMRRALEIVQNMIDGEMIANAVTDIRTMKPLKDVVSEALRAGDNHETPPSPERMREVLETIISALDRATGDTDAPYAETDEDYRDQYPVHWAMQKLNALLQSLRAGDNHASAPSEQLPSDDLGAPLERIRTEAARLGYALVPNDREDDPLSARDLTMMDQAWENHKAALPVATVINDNQPGRTAIIEITIDPPTLGLGTKLYASPKTVKLISADEIAEELRIQIRKCGGVISSGSVSINKIAGALLALRGGE